MTAQNIAGDPLVVHLQLQDTTSPAAPSTAKEQSAAAGSPSGKSPAKPACPRPGCPGCPKTSRR